MRERLTWKIWPHKLCFTIFFPLLYFLLLLFIQYNSLKTHWNISNTPIVLRIVSLSHTPFLSHIYTYTPYLFPIFLSFFLLFIRINVVVDSILHATPWSAGYSNENWNTSRAIRFNISCFIVCRASILI